ncbi:hypothetical protein WA026_021022 [Henosepilachna vigintioctopunctata]|uniref:Platelet-derived growth factor (PDGF) family profile domain-containing protein n=1 Tax=Henosepilachna vigintioctopunctata TaxID=420089 RepID=A0AAW1VD04_9CUCU
MCRRTAVRVSLIIGFVLISLVNCLEFYQKSCALSCRVPQPRSLGVAELVNTTLDIRPYMVVLFRCDEGTGCCQKGKTCQVQNFDDLELRFPTLIDSKYKLVRYLVRNHTECSCQTSRNNIKR